MRLDAEQSVCTIQYVSDLETEHRHLLQLVEEQKTELENARDLISTLQEIAQQKRSRNDSSSFSSAESSLDASEPHSAAGSLDMFKGTFGTDVPVSPWSIPYAQPFTGGFNYEGILNGIVSKSPMPMGNMFSK